MIPKLLKRFYIKPDSHQRDYIGIWQTNECYVVPFLSVENIIRRGNAYVRLGWLFWYAEYFRDNVVSTGCNEEEQGNVEGGSGIGTV